MSKSNLRVSDSNTIVSGALHYQNIEIALDAVTCTPCVRFYGYQYKDSKPPWVSFMPEDIPFLVEQLEAFKETGKFKMPEPKYVPWTYDTCPLQPGDILRHKSSGDTHKVSSVLRFTDPFDQIFKIEIRLTSSFYNLQELFEHWTFNDKPCGALKQ